jgi:hypothetical protein
MSETEKPFTVSDRRHFAPDGRPREGAEAPPEPQSPPDPGVPPEPPRGTPPSRPGPTPAADFSQFLVSLGAQAGLLLSGEGRPEGMGTAEALEGAQSVIAILEMLKDKTEGRRSSAEDALLEDLLFQLRMAFVEASRGGGA